MKEFSMPIGERKYFYGGFQVRVESPMSIINKNILPSETAFHEAEHAVAGEENGTHVTKSSIVGGLDYEGYTEFTTFDEVVAVAPHANGRHGTSYDLMLAHHYGSNPDSSMRIARNILAKKQPQVQAVASRLEEKRTLSGYEIRDVMQRVERGSEVTIYIKNPDGQEQMIKQEGIKSATVKISGEVFDLPKAA